MDGFFWGRGSSFSWRNLRASLLRLVLNVRSMRIFPQKFACCPRSSTSYDWPRGSSRRPCPTFEPGIVRTGRPSSEKSLLSLRSSLCESCDVKKLISGNQDLFCNLNNFPNRIIKIIWQYEVLWI